MKSTILAIIIVCEMTLIACSQEIPAHKIPSVVSNTLHVKFPGAEKIEWEKKNKFYEAEFFIGRKEHTAYLDASGRMMLYKIDIPIPELPESVVKTISENYKDFEIDDAEKIEHNNQVFYETELDSKTKSSIKLIFSNEGKILPGDYFINLTK